MWIKAAQNFLTGAIIYYFNRGLAFVETMVEIQLLSILDVIDEIMDGDDEEAKIYIIKLSEVSEKVICNIGMELSNLATHWLRIPRSELSCHRKMALMSWTGQN